MFKVCSKEILSDFYTPVGCFLQLKKHYKNCQLFEGLDFNSEKNSHSMIVFESLTNFNASKEKIQIKHLDNNESSYNINNISIKNCLKNYIEDLKKKINISSNEIGLFGYIGYDSIKDIENIDIKESDDFKDLPDIRLDLYKNILVFNHFNQKLKIIQLLNTNTNEKNSFNEIIKFILPQESTTLNKINKFDLENEEYKSNFTDEEFEEKVKKGIEHCQVGDVFQVVLSRKFQISFMGDEFNVYRTLRSINPSPYLFYLDYENYKIFGSSPEASIIIKNEIAEIHPIAGTFKRTGDDEIDLIKAEELSKDPKEKSEHLMLVDLARNDLSKYCKEVKVKKLMEKQFFSHVIHLTSVVEGKVLDNKSSLDLLFGSYPAGTLSGAPKIKAMQIINENEKTNRKFYGGAIGFIGFNGDINTAIIIRSIISYKNTLHLQAGAGIVINSNPKSEVQEVYNKIAALKKAIKEAKELL